MYFIDDREDKIKKRIQQIFRELEIPQETKRLPIGDILYEDENKTIVFERKEIGDFVSSFRSGHLQEQLLNMQKNYDRSYLIISGSLGDFNEKALTGKWITKKSIITVSQRLGMMASLLVRYSVKFVLVKNDYELVKIIQKIVNKTADGKTLQPVIQKVNKADIFLSMLCQLPNISMEKARRIKEKYPSLVSLQSALLFNKFKVFGVGVKTEKTLRKLLLE